MGRITKVFGQHDERTLIQLEDVASRADAAALMADGHVGYVMPIGGVAAYDNKVSVVGVGFDIGCGNAAIRTNVRATQFEREDWDVRADEIAATVSFGVRRSNAADDAPVDNPLFASDAWSLLPREAKTETLLVKAAGQLGTVGSGNHYVDLFADENDAIWVGVHFGSRGFGHKTASGFLALAHGLKFDEQAKEGEIDSPPILFPIDSELGQAYIDSMTLAGKYAYAGRDAVVATVLRILGADSLEEV